MSTAARIPLFLLVGAALAACGDDGGSGSTGTGGGATSTGATTATTATSTATTGSPTSGPTTSTSDGGGTTTSDGGGGNGTTSDGGGGNGSTTSDGGGGNGSTTSDGGGGNGSTTSDGGGGNGSTSNGGGGAGGDPCAGDCFETGCNPGFVCNVGIDDCGVCECPDATVDIDPLRSLYIRDPAVLDRPELSFASVLQRVVDSADAGANMDARDLYIAWFDTNNDAASAVAGGIHCSDTLNGFPLDCPRQEGVLAQRAADFASDPDADPLGDDHYKLVAVVARIDKIPVDGSNCGQYRFSYGLKDAVAPADPDDPDFNYLIFEGVLPNPTPGLGVAGCLPVAQYVVALDQAADADERAALIQGFFFDGLDGFEPVIDWSHFRGEPSGSGQLRTNQFIISVGDQPWQAREYYLARTGSSPADYELIVTPETVKENAYGRFFSAAGGGSETAAFQDWFVDTETEILASAEDINDIAFPVPPQFNSGQSTQPGFITGAPDEVYVGNYIQQVTGNTTLLDRIQTKLDDLGSDLTPENIVARAEQQTCAGCHQISGATADLHPLGGAIEAAAPFNGGYFGTGALGFVHTQSDIAGDGGYVMSGALTDEFLPHREQVLESFIADQCSQVIKSEPANVVPLPQGRVRAIGGGLASGH